MLEHVRDYVMDQQERLTKRLRLERANVGTAATQTGDPAELARNMREAQQTQRDLDAWTWVHFLLLEVADQDGSEQKAELDRRWSEVQNLLLSSDDASDLIALNRALVATRIKIDV